MPDVTGGDEDLDLSSAYRALERRRDDCAAQRDRITDEIAKLDAALDALRTLRDIGHVPAANGRHSAAPSARPSDGASTSAGAGASAGPQAPTM